MESKLSLQQIRELVSVPMARRGVVRAGIFGSVARGDDAESSDVDFLVEFESGRTLIDLAGLRLDLVEMLGREVDVATPQSLHPEMRQGVYDDLVTIL